MGGARPGSAVHGKTVVKCAAMQPCYLPWLGHLRLMAMADHFILLDDAQYSKNSWHNRNRILLSGGQVSWLTIPVSKDGLATPLDKVRIDADPRWRRKHAQTLHHSYGRHPYFADLAEIIERIEKGTQEFLADLNCDLLQFAALRCGIQAQIERSSALPVVGQRTERLEEFCRFYNCQIYVSTPGAREYLETDSFGVKAGLQLDFMDIGFSPYAQKGTAPFVPQLSFVDALANAGWDGVAELIFQRHS